MADLNTVVSGITFPNPVLPAAGPNVLNGRLMCEAAQGGAGGLVSKTVSTAPASDARPTIRRYGAKGLMNAETWSETPVESFLEELHLAKKTGLPLIASIGYRPEEVSRLGKLIEREIEPAGFEFSTHYTGKSTLPLVEVASALRRSVSLPIWMKLSPNFPNLEELALAVEPHVDGFVAVNSYGPVLDIDVETLQPLLGSSFGQGWLSGSPLLPIALEIVYRLRQRLSKPIIGVGGISRGSDAVKYFMAGASLVQVCSAAIREGNGVYGRIAGELSSWLDEHGYARIGEIADLYREKLEARRTFTAKPAMTVKKDLCTGCGACIRRCVHGALTLVGKPEKATVTPGRCIGCGFCRDFCPEFAMALEEAAALEE
jgi:dihydroorotate dehydrogenase/NAD-dependent dihydropyrimidine dehydrogenase PreA subunit